MPNANSPAPGLDTPEGSGISNVTDRAASSPAGGEIKARVDAYLNTLAADTMNQAAAQLRVHMDPFHQRMVIEDVRRQIPQRITHYMEEEQARAENDSARTSSDWMRSTADRTIRDCEQALLQYVQNLATMKG